MAATVEQLAVLIRGRLVGDGSVSIASARSVSEAGPEDITFIEDPKYARHLKSSRAAAAIVGPHFRVPEERGSLPTIQVEDPLSAFITVHEHLRGPKRPRWSGIHERAFVAESAKLGPDVAIHPFAYIGEGVEIGEGSTIHPHAYIGPDCKLGQGVTIHPSAVLYEGTVLGDRVEVHAGTVLGGDGFGYRLQNGQHVKIPQAGTVQIANDVEIGANCTIDRGTFEATVIGEGSKIDNLVMIGHNNQIGRHNVLCGQVGIAGSCKTGDYVVMGGQVGIKDHVEIGDRVAVGAQAGVHRNIPTDQNVLGSPAIPIKEQRLIFAMIARLPEMHRQLRELSAQVTLLTAATDSEPSDEGDL